MKTNLITRAGWHKLDDELKHLWKVERPAVTQAVSEAAALGDRSENAEYIYGKKRLREIDRRIRYLMKRLEAVKIVDHDPRQNGKVFSAPGSSWKTKKVKRCATASSAPTRSTPKTTTSPSTRPWPGR
jgi:hypothetical protein